MKVGVVSTFPEQQDGIALYTAALCEGLENAGITIVKIGDNGSTTADYKINFKSLLLKWQLQKIIEEEKIDLLHIQYIAAHFGKLTFNLNLLLALGQNVPVIVTFHEVHTTTATIREKVLSLLQKWITKKAAVVIAHTRQQKEFLQLKYKKKQAYHVHHLVLPDLPKELKQLQLHKQKDKNLLLFGILNYGKGAEYLIRAMNELPDFKLTVAGKAVNKDYENLIKTAVAENKLGNVRLDIRWVPEEEKKKLLEEAGIMVFPYVWAPYQSGTMHNAFSYGMPVVVTNAGIISEVVKEFGCGEVVEQRSPKALAKGIKKVHGNYSHYQKGVLKYREEASCQKVAQRHAEIYSKALQEHYEAKLGLGEQ